MAIEFDGWTNLASVQLAVLPVAVEGLEPHFPMAQQFQVHTAERIPDLHSLERGIVQLGNLPDIWELRYNLSGKTPDYLG